MVAQAPHPSDSYRSASDAEPLRPVREAVVVLEGLLKILFPDPLSLDIITVENIVQRYPLTGLGAPALAAIDQSQRIVRARGDYGQSGLAEFHIGLIYLHWDDCRAAANQFALARQPWSLAGDAPAMCLAHYAQGLGLYHSYHNEAAMLQFSRAERLLNRPATGTQGERFAALAKEMRRVLLIAQETLRDSLWPKEQQSAEVLQAGYLSVPPNMAPETPPAAQAATEPDPRHALRRRAERPEWAKRVSPPFSNLPDGIGDTPRGPLPGHITTDERFVWYQIADRKGEFLPNVSSGMWVLADREVDERGPVGREYVVVGGAQDELGSIAVRPIAHGSAMPYCYLGYRVADEAAPEQSRIFLDNDEQPSAPDEVLVLAVVEGFWYGLNSRALPGSD